MKWYIINVPPQNSQYYMCIDINFSFIVILEKAKIKCRSEYLCWCHTEQLSFSALLPLTIISPARKNDCLHRSILDPPNVPHLSYILGCLFGMKLMCSFILSTTRSGWNKIHNTYNTYNTTIIQCTKDVSFICDNGNCNHFVHEG